MTENKNGGDKQSVYMTAFYKVNDWYARHNIGTRTTLIIFLLMYVLSVLGEIDSINIINDNNTTQKAAQHIYSTSLVETTGWFAFLAFLAITFGDNMVSKIGDIITRVKGK